MGTAAKAILFRLTAFLALWGTLLAPLTVPIIRKYEAAEALDRPFSRLVLESLSLVSTILAVAMVMWLFDRRSFASIGFLRGTSFQHMLLGLGLGAGMVGLTLAILRLTGHLELGSRGRPIWWPLLVMISAVLLNAITQQVMVRYVQVTVAEFISPLAGLVVSALVFSALHLGATRGAPLASFNLLLAGVLLGYSYLSTQDLWLPIAVHFSWNALWGPVLGLTVSGRSLSSGWQLVRLTGSETVTGGSFGVEGGVAATIATIWGLLLVFLRYGY
ncbi:MAG: CPBP family intramembrane glutamic endopeptidase [bacterium]|nr:CPBP family intramembrane glutamic endopeptidase [bacterium]